MSSLCVSCGGYGAVLWKYGCDVTLKEMEINQIDVADEQHFAITMKDILRGVGKSYSIDLSLLE